MAQFGCLFCAKFKFNLIYNWVQHGSSTTFESGLRFVCFFSEEIEMERRVLFCCLLLIFAFLGYCNSQGELVYLSFWNIFYTLRKPVTVMSAVLSTLPDNPGDSRFWTVSSGLQIRVWYLWDNRQSCYCCGLDFPTVKFQIVCIVCATVNMECFLINSGMPP